MEGLKKKCGRAGFEEERSHTSPARMKKPHALEREGVPVSIHQDPVRDASGSLFSLPSHSPSPTGHTWVQRPAEDMVPCVDGF